MWTKRKCSRVTFQNDLVRDLFQGIVEAGLQSFSLLIAIRVFHASVFMKSCIASAEHLGLFLTAASVALAEWTRLKTVQLWAGYFFLSALCFWLSSLTSCVWLYGILIVLAKVLYRQKEPPMVAVYNHNYSPNERGKRLSYCLIGSSLTGILFSKIGGHWLDVSMDHYRWILWSLAGACLCAGLAVLRIPSKRWLSGGGKIPFTCFKYLWTDKLFGYMELGWVLLGFGNLMTLPIRIEYLANPLYGINASNTVVAIMTFGIPAAARILTMRLWGHLFDKLNFIYLRLLLNAFWIFGLMFYFFSSNLIVIGIGSIFIGMAMGGGTLVWTLWVTKITHKERVPAYMGVHTSIIGLRGLTAPFLGYWILKNANVPTVAWVGIVFTLISTAIFWGVRRHPRVKG